MYIMSSTHVTISLSLYGLLTKRNITDLLLNCLSSDPLIVRDHSVECIFTENQKA